MARTRAHYCVVQYVPNGGRAEAANVGVLLCVPSHRWMDVRMSPTLERVRQFFRPGKAQLQRIEIAVEALKHRIGLSGAEFASEDELARFAAARADAVRLTAPRVIMVNDPIGDLEGLYSELVGDRDDLIAMAAFLPSLPPTVARVFGQLESEGRIWRPRKITVPEVNRQFDVPYAFRNGCVNYVSPQALSGGKRAETRMEKLGFTGRLIHQHPIHGELGKLVVLSTDPGTDPTVEQRFVRTMDDFNVRFVPNAEADAFAQEVEQSAKPK